MAVNIGTLAAGIGSGIKNIGTTIPTIQGQMQQAALRGAQQAQVEANMRDRVASQQAIANLAKNLGYSPDMFGGASTAEEARSRLLYNAALRGYGAAGMLNPVQQVVQAAQQIQANQPQPAPQDTSFGEDANVIKPISAIGKKAPASDVEMARQQSAQNVGRNAELLKQIIQDTGAIENALKGGGMYRSTPNGGYFNSYYAEGGVADPEARAMYQAREQAKVQDIQDKIKDRKQRTAIARQKANKKGNGRGHGRGGSYYVEDSVNGVKGQRNRKNNKFTPYPKSMQGGSGGGMGEW